MVLALASGPMALALAPVALALASKVQASALALMDEAALALTTSLFISMAFEDNCCGGIEQVLGLLYAIYSIGMWIVEH